ncbi:hypothetical protein FKP32DRAFT_1096456 [Trametes sanguinea]|nr:hypothetical protein FKP32DRAFT_1096456 [Trametes sanguinea]
MDPRSRGLADRCWLHAFSATLTGHLHRSWAVVRRSAVARAQHREAHHQRSTGPHSSINQARPFIGVSCGCARHELHHEQCVRGHTFDTRSPEDSGAVVRN